MLHKENSKSRRNFIKSTAMAAAAFTIVPRHVLAGSGFTAPSDKQSSLLSCNSNYGSFIMGVTL